MMRGRSRRTVSTYVSAAALELGVLVVFVLLAKPQLSAALMSLVDQLASSAVPAARAGDASQFAQPASFGNLNSNLNASAMIPNVSNVGAPNHSTMNGNGSGPTQLTADDWRVATSQNSGRDISQWGLVTPRTAQPPTAPSMMPSVQPMATSTYTGPSYHPQPTVASPASLPTTSPRYETEYRTAYAPYSATTSGPYNSYARHNVVASRPVPDYRAMNYAGSDWK